VFQMQIQLTGQRANAAQVRASLLSLELSGVRSELTRVGMEVARSQAALQRVQSMVPPGTVIDQMSPLYEQSAQAKAQLDTGRQLQGQLQTRETELVTALAAEQARLDGLTRRLDDLEKVLATRR